MEKKKIIKIGLIVLAIVVIGVVTFKIFTTKQTISIDIASTNISYTYGPNGISESTLSVNDTLKVKILPEKVKNVKCYSSDEKIIKFDSDNIATALSGGSAQIYCKTWNSKSNVIDIVVKGA